MVLNKPMKKLFIGSAVVALLLTGTVRGQQPGNSWLSGAERSQVPVSLLRLRSQLEVLDSRREMRGVAVLHSAMVDVLRSASYPTWLFS
jgi:hypothetical protein